MLRPISGLALLAACCGCGPGAPAPATGGGAPATRIVSALATLAHGCSARGQLPDPACTPGAVLPKATPRLICQPGYARRARSVLPSTKVAVYSAYGISAHRAGQYEIDHLVPLELGGSNTRANLWPEAAPGYAEKDAVENALHAAVCSGQADLPTAQSQIARDWRHADPSAPALPPHRRPATSPSAPPTGASQASPPGTAA